MKAEYIKLIASLDRTLTMLRQIWLDAHVNKKRKHMTHINETLEERFRLMQLRDSQ
jgi:hypothetical protein